MKQTASLILLIMIWMVPLVLAAQHTDRNIHIETIVDAPLPRVWTAWTTGRGLETFMAPSCHVDLRIDGKLDLFFYPRAKPGQRGAEGMRILSVIPHKMFGFTWSNPRDFPEISQQRTHVTLKFYPVKGNPQKTKLVLIHDGWGDGEIWDQAYRYFIRAWKEVVLFRLHYRFDHGPINWNNPPKNTDRYNIIVN